MEEIHASGEEYLKWILRLQKELGGVRNVDLARYMSYSKASITLAMRQLTAKNYVTRDDDGYFHLTETGTAIAESMNDRHKVITDFLTSLGVDPDIAISDACHIEHVISEESFQKLKEFNQNNTEKNPGSGK